MRVQIRITGDKETIERIKKLGDRLIRFKPEMEQIGSELETYYSGQVFASQGGIIGSKWNRLSTSYASYKAKRYPGRPLLVRTGKMIGGFRHSATEQSVEVYNRIPYATYHQNGTSRMPARPIIGVNGDVKNIIGQLIERGVRRRIEETA